MPSQEKSTKFNVYLSPASRNLIPDSRHIIEIPFDLFSSAYSHLVSILEGMPSKGVDDDLLDYTFYGRELKLEEGVAQFGIAHSKSVNSNGFPMIRLRHTTGTPMGLARKVGLV